MVDETPGCNLTADQWNELYPIGQKVICLDGNGGGFETCTVGEAWRVGHSDVLDRETAMVMVRKSGKHVGWCLNFLEVAE